MTKNNEEEIEETEDTQEQDLEKTLEKEGEETEEEETIESLKKKLATSDAQKDHWRKKAQGVTTAPKGAEEKPKGELSSLDTLALARSNIHDDDIPEVLEYAKFKNIPVSEALKLNTVKAIIAENTEFRKTAEVTTTGAAKKTVSKVSEQTLTENLSKGVVPEKGSKEAEDLYWARRGGKR